MKKKTPDTTISAGSAAALTARITATLGPLDADEQACAEKLEGLAADVAKLQQQITDAEENLRIIKGAKVDAIRSLMSADPLLAEAFGAGGTATAPAEAEEVAEAAIVDDDEEVVEASVEEADDEDGNPLLKMDD